MAWEVQGFFLIILETEKSKIKVSDSLITGENALPGF